MTEQQQKIINHLKEEMRTLEGLNTRRHNQIEVLKKELKRFVDLYINEIE